MAAKGYLEGRRMAQTFSFLRVNELIWACAIETYLKGKPPLPFDILYWNSDPTRMPAGMLSFYLRECYLHNALSAGRMVLDGVPIDLKRVTVPVYSLAMRDDHIAPLASVFKAGRHLGGDTRLVVAGSGHVAGIVNPPAAGKYGYWTNQTGGATPEAVDLFDRAVAAFNLYSGDPIALLDQAAEERIGQLHRGTVADHANSCCWCEPWRPRTAAGDPVRRQR